MKWEVNLGYKVTFKKSVFRDLKKISRDQVNNILKKIAKDLSEKADTYPILTGKFAGLRKYRSGDYRVIFTIIDNTVKLDLTRQVAGSVGRIFLTVSILRIEQLNHRLTFHFYNA